MIAAMETARQVHSARDWRTPMGPTVKRDPRKLLFLFLAVGRGG